MIIMKDTQSEYKIYDEKIKKGSQIFLAAFLAKLHN